MSYIPHGIPEGTHLAYIISREAWYARAVARNPDINVMAAHENGGVAWEFSIEEVPLGGPPAIQVKVFEDAFAAFCQIPEFFRLLANQNVTTLVGVRELLDQLGAADETKRDDPYAPAEDRPAAGYREEPGIPRFGADPSEEG